jgi:hypothetical protein
MGLSSGRRTPRLLPSRLRQVRTVRFFRGLKSLRTCSNDPSLRELMLRLRLKVSMPNEVQTICNARGPGFNLRAAS